MKFFKFVLAFAFYILFTSCEINMESSYPKSDWTIMMYLADDYDTIGLINDVKEAIYNQKNTTDINLIILYDGPSKSGDISDPSILVLDSPFSISYRIVPIENLGVELDAYGEIDLSSQEALESYISYTKKMMPADNYALFFGSHGTGFQFSISSGLAVEDEVTKDSGLLTVREISDAIKAQNGVDLVYFDACNLGNIETVYQLKDSKVKYVVASPELIPGNGNQYTNLLLDIYNQDSLTPESLGRSLLQSYFEYYPSTSTINGLNTRSLLQMYDVELIKGIVESSAFKSDIKNFSDSDSSSDKFQYNSDIGEFFYADLLDLVTDPTELNSAITIADGGDYKFISIYRVLTNKEYYTTAYEYTYFNMETNWSSELTP